MEKKRTLIMIGNEFYLLPNTSFLSVKNKSELRSLVDSNAFHIRLLHINGGRNER